ncbi:MAG: VWA domain-containing protein [Pseudonocardiales bacterium]|nr:VWA domain-containing protein [Pseudonocardiales bacterium]
MVASWVRREFSGTGVTQYPPGPQLAVIQQQFGGRALLCIDVSGSMSGAPLQAAIEGGLDFLAEAGQAYYACGLVLWDTKVVNHVPTTAPASTVQAALRRAKSGGGTALAPALRRAIKELGPLKGDRVICVFGDGGIGDPAEAQRLAAEARALGIRFVVRGLGDHASASLTRVLTPEVKGEGQTVHNVEDLRQGIASMAAEVRMGRGRG